MAKVLVVDDSQLTSAVAMDWLTRMGHESIRIADGYGALPAYNAHKPDLIILDYNLPAASGKDVIQRLRDLPQGKTVPVLFLSAESPYMLESMVADLSRVRFLQKPAQEADFREKVAELLAL